MAEEHPPSPVLRTYLVRRRLRVKPAMTREAVPEGSFLFVSNDNFPQW